MKDCPGCAFLMGDEESLCGSCRSGERDSFPLDDLGAGELVVSNGVRPTFPDGGSASRASTLLLDPPGLASPRQEVHYRDPERGRRAVRSVVVLLVVAAVLGVLGPMALRGEGPLASTAVSLGLADPPVVVVPRAWTTISSSEGRFSAQLPVGASEHTQPVDPADPGRASYGGYRAELGEQGQSLVLSSDLGMGAALGSLDDAGFARLVDQFLSTSGLGTETVRRDALIGVGRVKDSVVVGDDQRSAARVRFLLAEDRLHVLVTEGPDEGSEALDEAHARLIDGFSATT